MVGVASQAAPAFRRTDAVRPGFCSSTKHRSRLSSSGGSPATALLAALFLCAVERVEAQEPFRFPTANHALFERGHEEKFFVGTTGKSWESGCFGCVRSEGSQMHEGLDIRCLERDRHGEPSDAVLAAADGTVVYCNLRPSRSNYGNYVVIRHRVDGLEIYSLYAHLSKIADGIAPGRAVEAGENIGVMGRTSNTRETISKDRAHVHFELNLFVNDRFPAWFKQTSPNERDDHGEWNGQNLLGVDPRLVLLGEHDAHDRFNMLDFLRSQTELCRVLVRKANFPWVKRYAALVRPNPVAARDGIAGYEIALNFNGVAFELIPRAASELDPGRKGRYSLLSVNESEYQSHPCRRLVERTGGRWQLAPAGISLLDLLTF